MPSNSKVPNILASISQHRNSVGIAMTSLEVQLAIYYRSISVKWQPNTSHVLLSFHTPILAPADLAIAWYTYTSAILLLRNRFVNELIVLRYNFVRPESLN